MSAYNLILTAFVFAVVLIMVADHRRGWLTELLVDGLRLFHNPRLNSSERSNPRSESDEA